VEQFDPELVVAEFVLRDVAVLAAGSQGEGEQEGICAHDQRGN